jgi:hypothetical protein
MQKTFSIVLYANSNTGIFKIHTYFQKCEALLVKFKKLIRKNTSFLNNPVENRVILCVV